MPTENQTKATRDYALVATPNARLRAVCSHALREQGLEMRAADDGRAAIEASAVLGPPRILITELSLARCDGFALLAELRTRHSPAVTSAVVMSPFAHLRSMAAELQDKLGIAWIVDCNGCEMFVQHAIHQALASTPRVAPEPALPERHRSPERAARMAAMRLVNDGRRTKCCARSSPTPRRSSACPSR